jgi:hypothetical protein
MSSGLIERPRYVYTSHPRCMEQASSEGAAWVHDHKLVLCPPIGGMYISNSRAARNRHLGEGAA